MPVGEKGGFEIKKLKIMLKKNIKIKKKKQSSNFNYKIAHYKNNVNYY